MKSIELQCWEKKKEISKKQEIKIHLDSYYPEINIFAVYSSNSFLCTYSISLHKHGIIQRALSPALGGCTVPRENSGSGVSLGSNPVCATHYLRSFPVASITQYHKWGGLTQQKFLLSELRSPEVWCHSAGRVGSFCSSEEESVLCLFIRASADCLQPSVLLGL